MGRGGEGNMLGAEPTKRSKLDAKSKLKRIKSCGEDLRTLATIWSFALLRKASSKSHAERLEQFYSAQAASYDNFRKNFLHGRRPLLASCAARIAAAGGPRPGAVWCDIGGGTGENVDMMAEYMPLDSFQRIYIVDLCKSLCEVARKKVRDKGWKNVVVVEGDACTFVPPEGKAQLITFSYSLSMIPPFHTAVDRAITYLDPVHGLLGVTDFFVPSRYDLPLRQMSWIRRFFWRATFDTDNIDIGPERRDYLDHRLSRVWEMNSQGSIPFVPYLRAPYYVWIGHVPQLATVLEENRVEAPPMFPPTFLYTQSWEDPRPDMEVLKICQDDTVLTLTSGGCNALNLLLHGAGRVVAVDCNPAQSALLELKTVAIRQLDFEDAWKMFGEGRHTGAKELFEKKLAPFLTQTSLAFWRGRLWYFQQGLYYQGGMGKVVYYMQLLAKWLGMGEAMDRLAHAPTLAAQRAAWESAWFISFCLRAPAWLVDAATRLLALLAFNRFVLWFGAGVPCKQYQLIHRDGLRISTYVARTFDGIARTSHLRKDNYFYYNCLTGRFARDNCPSYLVQDNFAALKGGLVNNLEIITGTFMEALQSRTYTKVILMDHVDWQDLAQARELAAVLAKQVAPGGRVIWRSAALCPPYARVIREAGFEVKCLQRADEGYMDRVNMYSSFYCAIRKAHAE